MESKSSNRYNKYKPSLEIRIHEAAHTAMNLQIGQLGPVKRALMTYVDACDYRTRDEAIWRKLSEIMRNSAQLERERKRRKGVGKVKSVRGRR